MKPSLRWVFVAGLAAVLALGVARLRFDADVLNLLPVKLDVVRGLQLRQAHFSSADDTLLTVEAGDEATAAAAAESLALRLRLSDRVAAAEWQSPFLEEPEALPELLAWIWLNRTPGEFDALVQGLEPDRAAAALAEAKETLATTFSPEEIARLGRDPFGLTRVPGSVGGLDIDPLADAEHRSPDGTFRVVPVRARESLRDYRDCALWIDFLREELTAWQAEDAARRSLKLGITGGPAFVAETATGMEGDLRKTTPLAAVAIALVFLAAHRRLKPLAWLLVLLTAVLCVTVAAGGFLVGSVNAVSLGFAVILLGVSVDHALVLYQEFKADPAAGAAGARRAAGWGIAWSAATTAAAFGSLALGSLPGMAQLGMLVAVGTLSGAAIMLLFFLPPLERGNEAGDDGAASDVAERVDVSKRAAGPPVGLKFAALGLAALTVAALGWRGAPRMTISDDPLRPTRSEAIEASDRMSDRMSQAGDPMMLLATGSGEAPVADRLKALREKLNELRKEGRVTDFLLPDGIFPNSANRATNAARVEGVAEALPRLRELAKETGFAPDALTLTEQIVRSWQRAGSESGRGIHSASTSGSPGRKAVSKPGSIQGGSGIDSAPRSGSDGRPAYPDSPVVRRLLEKAVAFDDSGAYALGLVYPPPEASLTERRALAAEVGGTDTDSRSILAGWDLLGAEIAEAVRRDAARIGLPAAAVVLALLFVAFRSWREAAFCLLALAFAAAVLLATMSLSGWSWTLINLPAIPLLLGLGVDYSIHMQLALRRHRGDWAEAWRTTGGALALCATTTSIGFAALALSHNQGLGDLGRVCAAGVLSAWASAVIALPALRSLLPVKWQDGAGDTENVGGPARIYGAAAWRMGLAVARVVPAGLLAALGRAGGSLYRLAAPARERVVVANLLPLVDNDAKRAAAAARGLFREFGEKLVSLWRFEAGEPVTARPEDERDWLHYDEAKRAGAGVLLVTPHLGNWELGGPTLTERGEKLLVLSQAEPGQGFTDIRRAGRARWGVETLIVGDDMFAFVGVIKRLQEGGAVALLIDRPERGKGVEVELCGRPFMASVAAAELARATGCAIVPVVIVREGKGHTLKTLPAAAYDRAALRSPEGRQALTQQIVRAFEPSLRQHPSQWFQFIPIWPEGES